MKHTGLPPQELISPFFRRLIQKQGHPKELIRQVYPDAREKRHCCTELDPLGDKSHFKSGIIQRFKNRVLLITSAKCFSQCRFCFRQNILSAFQGISTFSECDTITASLKNYNAVSEIILSGGEPFCMEPEILNYLIAGIGRINTIKTIRIHTRMPVFNPGVLKKKTIKILQGSGKIIVIVVHINHALEISNECAQTLLELSKSGFVVLAQSVLLAGINDSFAALSRLYKALAACRTLPYYLHQLDNAQGNAHFFVPEEKGKRMIRRLRDEIPGYLVPRYVRDGKNFNAKKNLI